MSEKKCPKCNEKLEKIISSGLEAEEFPEEEDLDYTCKNNHQFSSKDYNKL